MQRYVVKACLLWFVAIMQVVVLSAQNVDTVRVEPVVVWAKQGNDTLPITATITDWNATSPVITVNNYGFGGITTVSFRGLPARYTQIFGDELNLTPVYLGTADLSTLPVLLWDGVQVADIAQQAIGGVVRFFAQMPRQNALRTKFFYGSFGTAGVRHSFNLSQRKVKLSLRVLRFGSKNDYPYRNEFLPGRPFVRLKNAEFLQQAYAADLWLLPSDRVRVKIMTFLTFNQRNFPTPISYQGAPRTEIEQNLQNFSLLTAKFDHDFMRLKLCSGYNWLFSVYALGFNHKQVLRSTTEYLDLQSCLQLSRKNLSLKFALSNQLYANQIQEKILTQLNAERLDFSMQLRFSQSLGFATFQTHQILRYVERKLFYTFGYRLNLNRLPLTVALTKAVNFPSLNDLYWQPGGNPNLKPEISYSLEAQQRFFLAHGAFELLLTAGLKRIYNTIQWRPTEYHYWIATNFGQVNGYFTDILLHSRTFHLKKLNFSWTLGYGFHRFIDSLHTQIIFSPVHKLTTNLRLDFGLFSMLTDFMWQSRRYFLPGYTQDFLPGYAVINLKFQSKNFELNSVKLNFNLQLNNLTNTQYYLVPNRPQPGFQVLTQIQIILLDGQKKRTKHSFQS